MNRAKSTAQASAPALISKLDTHVIHTIPNRWRATSWRYREDVWWGSYRRFPSLTLSGDHDRPVLTTSNGRPFREPCQDGVGPRSQTRSGETIRARSGSASGSSTSMTPNCNRASASRWKTLPSCAMLRREPARRRFIAANGRRRIQIGRGRGAPYRVCERGPTPSWQGSPARHSVSIENNRGDVRSRSYRRFTP